MRYELSSGCEKHQFIGCCDEQTTYWSVGLMSCVLMSGMSVHERGQYEEYHGEMRAGGGMCHFL